MKRLFVFLAVAIFVVTLAGCSVNTKLIERERVDQETGGNRGYLKGTPPPAAERRATKKYYEVQVEFPSVTEESRVPKKVTQQEQAPAPAINYGTSVQEEGVKASAIEAQEKEKFTNYTVQKGETLQKISVKFFGTTKKWKKIFNANQDVLKSPDKVRPGMVIKIPKAPGVEIEKNEYIK